MSEACAYLTSRYPGLTHTFIVGEVRALRAAGVHVETATVRPVPDAELLSDVDRAEARSTHALLPVSPGRLLGCHARAFLRSPRAYAATLARALRLTPPGGRGPLWQLFYFAEAVLLLAWMEARGLRHVHVHHANVAADVAMLACTLANARRSGPRITWSLTVHGPGELVDQRAHALAAKVADAAAVVCISDFARSQVAALLPADDQERLHTVRCGIDTAAFRPVERPAASTPPTILCVAALEPRKGHAVLLEALALLRADGRAARLVLAGDGSERAALERRARALGVADAVEFKGAVGHDRVPELHAAADIFCLPSFAEGVPTVLMEAMATELPVVAANIMGVPELVDHEQSGLLVRPARPDLLAAALARLVDDPALRRRLGVAGRKRVEGEYERGRSTAALRAALGPLLRVSR